MAAEEKKEEERMRWSQKKKEPISVCNHQGHDLHMNHVTFILLISIVAISVIAAAEFIHTSRGQSPA